MHVKDPDDVTDGQDYTDNLNPDSLQILTGCLVEPSLATGKTGDHYQFLRQGYFCVDPDRTADRLVFNRTVLLRDTWAKVQKSGKR